MEFFNCIKHKEIASKYFEGSYEKMFEYIYEYMFFIFEISKYELKDVFICFESYKDDIVLVRLYGDEWEVTFNKHDEINKHKKGLLQSVLSLKERELNEKLAEADSMEKEVKKLKVTLETYG